MKQLRDEELIEQARAFGPEDGSNPFLDELFDRHQRRVALWALRFTETPEAAADLTQEILTNAWRDVPSFEGKSTFTTWLYTLARNHCWNSVNAAAAKRRDPMEPFKGELAEVHGLLAVGGEPRQTALETARRLIREALNDTERTVFTLHHGEELPAGVITKLLGLADSGGAEERIALSRRKLLEFARRWRSPHEASRIS